MKGTTFVGIAAFAAMSCSGGDKEAETPPPPTPAERMCALVAEAISGCASASPCDEAMVEDCSAVAAMLSDPMLTAAADCIEGGGAPFDCLTSSTSALAPTASHEAFAEQFCSECLFGLPGCEDAFYSDEGTDDDAGLAGALILPFGDDLVDALTAECASGLSCATFPTCAQGVMAEQAIPEATLACIVDTFTGALPPASDEGDCTVGGEGPDTTDPDDTDDTDPGACGARTYGACEACSEDQCCAQMLACDDGTPCGDLVACLNECADTGCIEACNAEHPAGVAPLNEWDTCVSRECIAPGTCDLGGVCGNGISYDGGGMCDDCVASSCCDEIGACMGDDFDACLTCLSGGPCTMAGDAVFTCLYDQCIDVCS